MRTDADLLLFDFTASRSVNQTKQNQQKILASDLSSLQYSIVAIENRLRWFPYCMLLNLVGLCSVRILHSGVAAERVEPLDGFSLAVCLIPESILSPAAYLYKDTALSVSELRTCRLHCHVCLQRPLLLQVEHPGAALLSFGDPWGTPTTPGGCISRRRYRLINTTHTHPFSHHK